MVGLPSPDSLLREARDFIFSSHLGRHALADSSLPRWPVALHDLIEAIHLLVLSCHMPEFTDHGLPHLCSLVDRLSLWELADGRLLIERLSPQESALLLLSTLVHDLGMLSQNAQDLPDDHPAWASRDQAMDVADWVRRTHVIRLPLLATRVLNEAGHGALVGDSRFSDALKIAAAHQQWPWQWEGPWQEHPRRRGLAALIAVADLLDEDSARCDTTTLLRHREGSALNRAHWLRHGLTSNRILVSRGSITIKMHKPPRTDTTLRPVFGALRNHFRLACLYCDDLHSLNADIEKINFSHSTGIPTEENMVLGEWNLLPEYANVNALSYQLLRSFMSEALKDSTRLTDSALQQLIRAGLEDVDLSSLRAAHPPREPGTEIEQSFQAIVGGGS
jgi:hypothetical protein